MKIALWPRFARAPLLDQLGREPDFDCHLVDDADSLRAALDGARALVMPGSSYDAQVARVLREQAGALRFIQLLTAGYEGLLEHGVPAGVRVANAGDSWSPAVAEHAVALMLAMVKCLPLAFSAQTRRSWDAGRIGPRMGTLQDRTLVIVGCGSIGREAARRARGLGMRVIGVARTARPMPDVDEVLAADQLDAALGRADMVLVAVPSSPATRGLIDAARLAACRPGAMLVNVARGNVVDSAALAQALRSGQLAAAGLDVTDPEPLTPEDPLWDAPNLIITPHVSGSSGPEGLARLARTVAANLRREADGETPHHLIAL